jgi:hypothetical protein
LILQHEEIQFHTSSPRWKFGEYVAGILAGGKLGFIDYGIIR